MGVMIMLQVYIYICMYIYISRHLLEILNMDRNIKTMHCKRFESLCSSVRSKKNASYFLFHLSVFSPDSKELIMPAGTCGKVAPVPEGK